MGAKPAKLAHLRVRSTLKYNCTECKRKCKKKELAYCQTCCEEHPESCMEAFSLCSVCSSAHSPSHIISPHIPSIGKTKRRLNRMGEELNEMEMDVGAALADVKENIWKVEKIQKERLSNLKESLDKAREDVEKKGKINNATRGKLHKMMEETRIRNKILISRLKLLEENGGHIFSSNGSDLQYHGAMSIRDSMRMDISRQRKLGNHGAAMETINELLEATNGRITLREAQLMARLVMEKIENINGVIERLGGVNGSIDGMSPTESSQQLLSGLLSNISSDFRTECAEMLDVLTRIHSHADVNVKGYACKDLSLGVTPPIDYILNLTPEETPKCGKKCTNIQRFLDTKIVVLRYYLAICVCSVWLEVTSEDKDEYTDVSQQLRDCIDGFIYSAKQAGWPQDHPLFSTLAGLLLDLCRKYTPVREMKCIRKKIRKIISANKPLATVTNSKISACSEQIERTLRNGYIEIWGEENEE